ncbi:type I-E CRISPR-associated protein Cse2/CasB [Pseudomonas jinjuensis]|uniref:CRISPR system Cascade subunit CasB n=1 Tax=Pseudomonas jinjuensis TaxID=198616 RepID=A0A1H0AU31_9PSED|nr:type I-E CRISPR-associated protein Cse2/CasB [Pseudomonas jinjuensis]SDN36988.1 CRISPR system Cascade subunit CasB [Pseudomonas jinjuensis]
MKARSSYLDEAQRQWVRDWWGALQPRPSDASSLSPMLAGLGRGARAMLRRCADLDGLLMESANHVLARRLIELDEHKTWRSLADANAYSHLALIGGVLAQVKEDLRDKRSLAWHLGNGAGNGRPSMSELRFKRLQRVRDPDDLYLQWRRAVQLADGKADVAQLADDLLAWLIEGERPVARASDGVKFRWAYDYYLTNREQAAAAEPESNKELTA